MVLVCILWSCEDWCDERLSLNLGSFYINVWRGKMPNTQVSQIFLLGVLHGPRNKAYCIGPILETPSEVIRGPDAEIRGLRGWSRRSLEETFP